LSDVSLLPSWEKVKAKFQKGGILIGNGASLAVWKNFGYRSLYEKAESHVEHPLSSEDKHIFKSLQTENFEPPSAFACAPHRPACAWKHLMCEGRRRNSFDTIKSVPSEFL